MHCMKVFEAQLLFTIVNHVHVGSPMPMFQRGVQLQELLLRRPLSRLQIRRPAEPQPSESVRRYDVSTLM